MAILIYDFNFSKWARTPPTEIFFGIQSNQRNIDKLKEIRRSGSHLERPFAEKLIRILSEIG